MSEIDAIRLNEAANPMLIGRVADTTAHRDREALDESVSALLLEFLDARSVSLFTVRRVEGATMLAHRASVQGDAAPVAGERSRATAPRCKEPLWRACIQDNRWTHGVLRRGAYVALFPIEDRGTVVGMLEVVCKTPMVARDTTLVRGILRILKNQLALLDYGERDTLTGLLNRKTFETRLQKMTRGLRAARRASGGEYWLGLLDIDHFKSINDEHGHLFGDEVLLLVSQIMVKTFRGADELFRFGGEEFVILLENADEAGARIAFERLRAAVEAHGFPQGSRVTVSVGYTRIRADDVPTTSIERADAALYHAKQHGRNAIRHYESLVAAGELGDVTKEGDVELF